MSLLILLYLPLGLKGYRGYYRVLKHTFIGGAKVYRAFFILLLGLLSSAVARAENGKVALAFPVRGVAIDGDLSDWPQTAVARAIDFARWQSPAGPEDP